MNDQLRKRRIEQPILVRQLLGDTALNLDPGMATPSGRDKQLRGVNGTDRASPEPCDQLPRQRARAAADIEHSLTGDDARELGEPGRQRYRIPAHEPVVLIRPSGEAHARESRGRRSTLSSPPALNRELPGTPSSARVAWLIVAGRGDPILPTRSLAGCIRHRPPSKHPEYRSPARTCVGHADPRGDAQMKTGRNHDPPGLTDPDSPQSAEQIIASSGPSRRGSSPPRRHQIRGQTNRLVRRQSPYDPFSIRQTGDARSRVSDRDADRQHNRSAERHDDERGAQADVQEPVSHVGNGE